MSISERTQQRLIYTVLWIPVLMIPTVYFFFSYLGERELTREDFIFGIQFTAPFVILFLIHDRLLVRCLFLRNKVKTYIVLTLLCLPAFSWLMHRRSLHHFAQQRERHMEEMRTRIARDADFPPFVDGSKARPHFIPPKGERKPQRPKGPNPAIWNTLIAFLLIGSNLSVTMFVKYMQEKKRNSDLENKQLQQELELLKAQINPHFLMNTLNNIHGMVELNPAVAQEMLLELSRLMRYVLYEGAKPYTTLHAELESIATYVNLMRKRYSSKKVNIHLLLPTPPSQNIAVPPLLFIVLIENAFKHGISYRQYSFINIEMAIDEAYIRLRCVNSRFDRHDNEARPHGIGLENLRKRLQRLYGEDFRLDIDEEEHTYAAYLTVPYKLKEPTDETLTMPGH